MAMESAASTTARARRILNGAKAKQKETWDELFQSADKDRSKMLDIKELKTTSWTLGQFLAHFTPPEFLEVFWLIVRMSCMTRMLMLERSLAWLAILCFGGSVAFVCSPDWPDDYCPSNGSFRDGCSPQGYKLLPKNPDWIDIRKRLVQEMFGQDQLPSDERPQHLTTFMAQHRLSIFHLGSGSVNCLREAGAAHGACVGDESSFECDLLQDDHLKGVSYTEHFWMGAWKRHLGRLGIWNGLDGF
eukprot:s59_g78.t3